MQETFYESERDLKEQVVHILLYNTECPLHFHNSLEILYVVEGSVHYLCSTNHIILNEGEAVFIPPFFSHRFYSEGPSITETVMIPDRYLHNFQRFYGDITLPILNDIEVNRKITEIFHEIRDNGGEANNPFLIHGLVDYLLGYLITNYPQFPYDKENKLMVDIAIYINENFQSKLTLESISSYFGYNPNYFSRLFKKLFNCNFNEYINNIRCQFIDNNRGKSSLTELIYRAGYSSPSSYYRRKRKHIR
ncbi:MAG: AraC family transcriptional regulator [Bacilli bacterium]